MISTLGGSTVVEVWINDLWNHWFFRIFFNKTLVLPTRWTAMIYSVKTLVRTISAYYVDHTCYNFSDMHIGKKIRFIIWFSEKEKRVGKKFTIYDSHSFLLTKSTWKWVFLSDEIRIWLSKRKMRTVFRWIQPSVAQVFKNQLDFFMFDYVTAWKLRFLTLSLSTYFDVFIATWNELCFVCKGI